jgi:hypothetical protein
MAEERRDGGQGIGRREARGWHGGGEGLLRLLGGLLLGFRAVLEEVLATSDAAHETTHARVWQTLAWVVSPFERMTWLIALLIMWF